jgi:hypothetical protein
MNYLKMFKNKFFNILKGFSKHTIPLSSFKNFINFSHRNFARQQINQIQVTPENVVKLLDDNTRKLSLGHQQQNYDFSTIFQTLEFIEIAHSSEIKSNSIKLLIQILKTKKFADSLNADELAKIFYASYFLRESIKQDDLNFLVDRFFELKNKDEIYKKDYVDMLDSIYYIEKLGMRLDEIKKFCMEKVAFFFDSYDQDEKFIVLVLILYMPGEDIRFFVDMVINYMNSLMESDKKLNSSTYEHIQYYMRILHECPDKDKLAKEAQKLRLFLLANMRNSSLDNLVCIVSNYCHYIEFDAELFEQSLNIIKTNIGATRNELLLELLFNFLHFDIDSFKESAKVADTMNIIISYLKDTNTTTLSLDYPKKECFYLNEVKEKLIKIFESWLYKIDKVKEKKYLPTFEVLVNKSLNSIPFATNVYEEDLFYMLYANFKRIARV